MSEIAVTLLLEKLASFLENEVELLQGLPEELEYIKDDLQSMKAFLRVADSVGESNPELKVWVQQLRDVAYDTEDVIDEFRLDFVHDNGHRICSFLYHICSYVQNLQVQHRIASKIQGIRSRVSNIHDRHMKFQDKFNIDEPGPSSTNADNPWLECRGDALLLDSIDLVGIEKPKEQLIKWLVGGNSKRKVVSVVGMGGSGKTTLVKQVYDDAYVKKYFTVHAWITVSHPFKREELLRDMVQQLFSAIRKPVPQGVDAMNADWLKMIVKALLQQTRYLIILDDVWYINEWDAVNYTFANNSRGSRVMLTTRKTDVASSSCIEAGDKVFNLEPLSPDESWTLFQKKSFRKSPCPPHLEKLSRSIIERCEGLPLAIVAISGVLASKKHRIDEWEMIYRSLGAEIQENDKLKNLKEVLSLSFNDLPYNLKSCFLYLSIFPEYHLIEHMRLVRLWVAEGLVEVKEGKTQEEVAEDYLNELLNRSLIQVAGTTTDGRVKACRIHDLLREIIISKSRDQNFAAVAKEQNAMWPDKVRRLSIHNTLQNVQQNRNISQLRSLYIFGVEDPLSKSAMRTLLHNDFRLLKVLDLRGAPLEIFPDEVISLHLLTYLSLRCTKVKIIPSSIGKLQDLQTLDLKHTEVSELPVEILKLQQLRHLLVYRYEFESYSRFHSKYGFKTLKGIGALQYLQKLCFIEAGQGGDSIITELGKLNQLRRLGIIKLRKEDGRALCSSIEKMTKLHALSIVSSAKDEAIDLQHLSSPPLFLQRLYLTGRLETLPNWIPSLQSLVVVYLKWSRLTDDLLVSLQHLPSLVHLELLHAYNGENLCFKAGGFKKLKFLGLDKFEELKSIQVEEGAMPKVEKLSIQRCKSLEKVPLGIEHLTKLKLLEFFDMPEDLIMKIRPDVQGGDYGKVAHIPEVYYTYWRNGEWEVYSLESSGEREPNAAIPSEERLNRWK